MFVIDRIKSYIRLYLLRHWYNKYERYLIPGALILGFLLDFLTFQLINFDSALTILAVHLIIAGLGISFINLYDADYFRKRLFPFLRVFMPLVVQFSFGAILSASILFYSFSGTLQSSWPFILVIIFLALANEIFKKHYTKPVFQFGVYFFCLFSFVILLLPYLIHVLGPMIFLLSGLVSVLLIALFIKLLWKNVPKIRRQVKPISGVIIGTFVLMNFFYFLRIIPPFPLSLRSIDIYHHVEKTTQGNYSVLKEDKNVLDFFRFYEIFHKVSSGDEVYIFSSVFSPTNLNLEIIHEWQYLDSKRKWQTVSSIPFPIIGGRKDGYRGYSLKRDLGEGKWRVNVKTTSGQIIGRIHFKLIKSEIAPSLEAELI